MPRRKKEDLPQEEIKKIKTPELVDGMRDLLPADEKYWIYAENAVRSIANDYSYKRMETPVLEKYELFNHALFKHSGALERIAFSFIDRGQKLILRPEATASIARAFVLHNMANQNMPLKAYYWGPMFRAGRSDVNRLRQFTQVGFEILGEKAPAIDAEIIIVANNLFKNLQLETEVRVSTVGCGICRLEYFKALTAYLKAKRGALCLDCRKRIIKNPKRFLNCGNQKCQRLREEAPQIVDWLCDECRSHLFRVLEYLDALGVVYKLDPTLVRTFDYYTKTIFEITPAGDDADKIALAAGGRYDTLVEMLGGPATPATGFSLGMERLVAVLKNAKVEVPAPAAPDIFVAQLSEAARQKIFAFYEELRKEKFSVRANFSKGSLKAQLDQATKINAKYVLILGQKEVTDGTILLRDLESGIQEVVNMDKVIKELRKRIFRIK